MRNICQRFILGIFKNNTFHAVSSFVCSKFLKNMNTQKKFKRMCKKKIAGSQVYSKKEVRVSFKCDFNVLKLGNLSRNKLFFIIAFVNRFTGTVIICDQRMAIISRHPTRNRFLQISIFIIVYSCYYAYSAAVSEEETTGLPIRKTSVSTEAYGSEVCR